MRKRLGRRWIAYGIVSAALFAALFLVSFSRGDGKAGERQAQIVVFGDSVFGLVRDETAISAQLEKRLGKSVYNAALGGTTMARQVGDGRLDYGKGSFSMLSLAKSVEAGDFGVQRAARMRENVTEYFPEVIQGLEELDFGQVETVLLQQGVNDYHAGTPIDNLEDPYDAYTFLGALRSVVRCLRQVNPDIRIVLVTPTFAWYFQDGKELTCEELDYGQGFLESYVEAELQLAQELEVEVIDVYHEFYPHENPEDWTQYTTDGLHPNEQGRQKLAERLAEALGAR